MMNAVSKNASNLEMFGVPDVDVWFRTAVYNNSVSDLILGLSSDAQACMENGDLHKANCRLNRIKWLAANKLNVR